MKFSKSLIIISLLLVFCISLGAVSAVDDADMSVNDMDNVATVESSINVDDEISTVSEGEIHNSSEIYDEIKNAKGTYNITNDYQIDTNWIISNDNVIIEGNNHTIYGNGYHALKITGNNVIIKNLNFINCCYAEYIGSAIFFTDCFGCSVSGCSFVNCSADDGGAIGFIGCSGCSVSGCSFVNCSADRGGAIYFTSSSGSINYCIFDNNIARSYMDVLGMGGVFNFFGFQNNVTKFPSGLTNGAPDNWVVLDVVKSGDEYVVKFVDNYGRDLTSFMPDYNASLTINGVTKDICIKNNTFRGPFVEGTYLVTSPNSGKILAKNVFLDHEIEVIDCEYGEDAIVNINFTNDIFGNVTVYVDGKVFTGTISNNSVTIPMSGLSAGMHAIHSFYNDSKFDTSIVTVYPTPKYDMNFSVENITYGQDAIINVTLPTDATGNVTLFINNLNITQPIKNGQVSFNITKLVGAGNYDFNLNYTGDNKYTSKLVNGSFNIEKYPSEVIVSASDVPYPSDVNVIVTLDALKASGNITYYLNGKKYAVKDVSDLGLIIKNPYGGFYSLVVEYSGDSNNTNSSASCNFTVIRKNIYMNVSADNITFGEVAHVVVTLPDDAMGYVDLYINDKYYDDSTVRSGVATFNIGGLSPNKYNIKVVYSGDAKYSPSNVTTNVTVNKAHIDIIPTALSTTYGSGKYFTVKVLNKNKKPVSGVKLTLKIYTGSKVNKTVTVTTDKNGIAKYSASKLSIGTHKVVITFSNPNYIVDSNKNSSITISKAKKSSMDEERDNGKESVSYNNGNNRVSNSVGNMENCGTPLVALLIALISLPILRRRK